MSSVPTGFAEMPPFGPFHRLVGPIYYKNTENGYVVGLQVEEKHHNAAANLHGGMICALVDTAFTWAVKNARAPGTRAVTTNLTVDLIGPAVAGDWIEAHVDVVKAGRRLVFLNCFVWKDGLRIARGNAQFQVMTAAAPAPVAS